MAGQSRFLLKIKKEIPRILRKLDKPEKVLDHKKKEALVKLPEVNGALKNIRDVRSRLEKISLSVEDLLDGIKDKG